MHSITLFPRLTMVADTFLDNELESHCWESAVSIDARGLPCPQPLLALRRALRNSAPGTLLRIQTTDPASQRDLASFAKLSGQPLLRVEKQDGVFSFWLRSKLSSASPQ